MFGCCRVCFGVRYSACYSVCCRVCCRVCSSATGTVCCTVCCDVCCRVVPYIAEWCRVLQWSAAEIIIMMISHCNSLLQCVAAWCRVLQCAAYSPCTTCRVPSLPTHALLALAVYHRTHMYVNESLHTYERITSYIYI